MAVAAVVAYHLWPDAVRGGYLGVDLFMALSGFLITGLLLDEHGQRGSIRLGAFWARRFRRLVPALLLLLAGVAVWVHLAWRDLAPTVRGQGLAALAYVANWRLVADGVSYASLQEPPSPLLHLWSLAVEEQFYVVWPLVAVWALGRGRSRLARVALAGAVASAVTMAVWHSPDADPLRLYYGTDTRAQTFLVGAVAAVLVRRRPRAAARVAPVGGAALAAAFGAFLLAEEGDGLYRGGFLVFALVAAVAVVAATVPGPVTWLLDRPGLRLVGRTSYGIYLWHWPVLVLVGEDELGVGGAPLLALRLALIAVLTATSWCLVERTAARGDRRTIVAMGVGGAAVAAVALLTMPATSTVPYADVDVASAPPASVVTLPPSSAPAASTGPVPTVAPGTVLVIGDSGTYDAVPALAAAFGSVGSQLVSAAYPGMGVTRPDDVLDRWSEAVTTYSPDLVVVQLGGWDSGFLVERGDDAYRAALDATVATLSAGGARILWLAPLPGGQPIDGDPGRLFAELPGRHPGVVEHLEVDAALAAPGGGFPRVVGGEVLRKGDGWHLCPAGARNVAAAVLDHLGLEGSGWEVGPWREDARYDEPAGACAA